MDVTQTENIKRNVQEQPEVEIRPATSKDFDALTDICRVCFPEQIRWRAPKSHSRKWWHLLIDSQNCELWLALIDERVVAFVTLVFDENKYVRAWYNHRLSLSHTLYIIITCPKQSLKRFCTKVKQKRNRMQKKASRSSQDAQLLPDHVKTKNIFAQNTPWCGPIAVMPGARGDGVSLTVNKYCFERAKTLGYQEIFGVIRKKNVMSRVMAAMLGFEVIDEIHDFLFYRKMLKNSDDTRVGSDR